MVIHRILFRKTSGITIFFVLLVIVVAFLLFISHHTSKHDSLNNIVLPASKDLSLRKLVQPTYKDLPRNRVLSYRNEFSWPLDRTDFRHIVTNILDGKTIPDDVSPINRFLPNTFTIDCHDKCEQGNPPKIMIVVKSSITNTGHRNAIRKSWGNETRFTNTTIKTVFLVGSCDSLNHNRVVKYDTWTKFFKSNLTPSNCDDMIYEESELHHDIVQIDYIDTYYNNSIKAIGGFEWLRKYCSEAEYALFVDDDFYISVKNLLSFINNPFQDPLTELEDDYFPFDGRMYAGHVAFGRTPDRHSDHKWYNSIEEYPFDKFPNFVRAGAYLVSNRVFKEIAVAAPFVKIFNFDDNYLAIIAKKLDIKLLHNVKFLKDDPPKDLKELEDLIGIHGSGDYEAMYKIWKEQISQ